MNCPGALNAKNMHRKAVTNIGHFSRNSRIHTESVAVKLGSPQDNRHSLPDSLLYSEPLLQSAIHEYAV